MSRCVIGFTNTDHLVLLFIFNLLGMNWTNAFRDPSGLLTRKNVVAARLGDINIGFLADAHESDPVTGVCTNTMSGSMCANQMTANLALDEINNSTDILPNITLGIVSVDACGNELHSLESSMLFVKEPNDECPSSESIVSPSSANDLNSYDVVAILGPIYSDAAIAVSPLMGIYEMPMMGLFTTSDDLSDKSLYPYFTRLVAPDSFMAHALIDLAVFHHWSYVSIVYSDGPYGENGASQTDRWIRSVSAHYNICIAMSLKIPSTPDLEDYNNVVRALMSDSKARVVITFMRYFDIYNLIPLANQVAGIGRYLWLAADSFTSFTQLPNSRNMIGSIFVDHPGHVIPAFMTYAYSSEFWTLNNVWLNQLWQNKYNCTISDHAYVSGTRCEFNVSKISAICGFNYWATANRVYDSIHVFAQALHSLITSECPEALSNKTILNDCIRGDLLLSYILNTTTNGTLGPIEFTSSGDLLETLVVRQIRWKTNQSTAGVKIGTWSATEGLRLNSQTVDWTLFQKDISDDNDITYSDQLDTNISSSHPVLSMCSQVCSINEYVIAQSSPCCWVCDSCRNNEIIMSNRTGCESCPSFTWPYSAGATTCVPIEPTYIHPTNPISIVMISLGALGALFTLTVIWVYKYRARHQLVKATCRELCFVILSGTMMVSVIVFLFVVKPDSNTICSVRSIGFHVSINLIYAPLLVKNWRIYRIFSQAQRSTGRPAWTSTKFQLFLTAIISIVQMTLTLLVELLHPAQSALLMPSSYEPYVELYCHNSPVIFLIPLSYNIIIIVVCTIVGFVTRKLPENFNESWFIFLSAATTLFSWAVFVPAYFTTVNAYLQSTILGCCLILNCMVTLGCLFGPILYAVAFVPTERIKLLPSGMMSTVVTVSAIDPPSTSYKKQLTADVSDVTSMY